MLPKIYHNYPWMQFDQNRIRTYSQKQLGQSNETGLKIILLRVTSIFLCKYVILDFEEKINKRHSYIPPIK